MALRSFGWVCLVGLSQMALASTPTGSELVLEETLEGFHEVQLPAPGQVIFDSPPPVNERAEEGEVTAGEDADAATESDSQGR